MYYWSSLEYFKIIFLFIFFFVILWTLGPNYWYEGHGLNSLEFTLYIKIWSCVVLEKKFRKTNILFLDILFQMMLCTILFFYLTQWFYKRGKNCDTFTDEGTDRRRNRHIYWGMECRWSEKFTWTFGLDELKSAHIIHEAIGHFQTSFEKDKQLFVCIRN